MLFEGGQLSQRIRALLGALQSGQVLEDLTDRTILGDRHPDRLPAEGGERLDRFLVGRVDHRHGQLVAGIDEPAAARGDLKGQKATPGGTITSYLRLEGPAQNRVRAALITGDFFVTPPRIIYDLESKLRGVYLADVPSTVRTFFEEARAEVLSVTAEDFVASIENALAST